jgi:nitrogenase molybdenum-iron protein alpha/beta subunit
MERSHKNALAVSYTHIGVVGYCPPTKFDEVEARCMIEEAYDKVAEQFAGKAIVIVSGLTDVGVLAIAYREAARRRWMTAGIACKKATEHPLYPVDMKQIVGDNWGDESDAFVALLNGMIRIGGSKQSARETATIKAKGLPTFEYDLPVLVN